MARNEQYSGQDFTGQDLTDRPASEFSNSEIHGSCFAQESDWDADSQGNSAKNPAKIIFPPSMSGVAFIGCNLDNVKIPGPPDAFIGEGTTTRMIRVQNDNKDWVLHPSTHKPDVPANLKAAQKAGHNTNAANIPEDRIPLDEIS